MPNDEMIKRAEDAEVVDVDTMNKFLVSSQGQNIVVMNPMPLTRGLSHADALVFAAWIVAIAGGEEAFLRALRAVEST